MLRDRRRLALRTWWLEEGVWEGSVYKVGFGGVDRLAGELGTVLWGLLDWELDGNYEVDARLLKAPLAWAELKVTLGIKAAVLACPQSSICFLV